MSWALTRDKPVNSGDTKNNEISGLDAADRDARLPGHADALGEIERQLAR